MQYLALLAFGISLLGGVGRNGVNDDNNNEPPPNENRSNDCPQKVYDLLLNIVVDLDANTFSGLVVIVINVDLFSEETRQLLYLHAFPRLLIDESKTTLRNMANGDMVPIQNQCRHQEFEFWVIEVAFLTRGHYGLEMKFSGNMTNHGLRGLLATDYFDALKNRRVKFAATHFELTNARKAFPGFDEPAFKAAFHIDLQSSFRQKTDLE